MLNIKPSFYLSLLFCKLLIFLYCSLFCRKCDGGFHFSWLNEFKVLLFNNPETITPVTVHSHIIMTQSILCFYWSHLKFFYNFSKTIWIVSNCLWLVLLITTINKKVNVHVYCLHCYVSQES